MKFLFSLIPLSGILEANRPIVSICAKQDTVVQNSFTSGQRLGELMRHENERESEIQSFKRLQAYLVPIKKVESIRYAAYLVYNVTDVVDATMSSPLFNKYYKHKVSLMDLFHHFVIQIDSSRILINQKFKKFESSNFNIEIQELYDDISSDTAPEGEKIVAAKG